MLDLKKVFVLGTIGFIVVSLALFYLLTTSVTSRALQENENQLEYKKLESKLNRLEDALKAHRDSLQEVEGLVNQKIKVDPVQQLQLHGERKPLLSEEQCSAAVGLGLQAKSDVNMLNVYDLLKFDNPNGGVWKQGWDVEIDMKRFTPQNKLRVFVIPHSHNDPGWIKTFEKYFEDETKPILDSMLLKLQQNPDVKFIWAEISYFSLWWNTLGSAQKDQVKSLVDNHQLEFVTGGWVMPDEAGAHYYSMLNQLVEGHQYLFHHLGYIPKSGWSIDPFGMSPTNAYLNKRSGLKNMLIQRTHYAVKKELSRRQQLEFKWRQIWDNEGSSDILCHMMPFYSYDIPHTCGPDPKVCCQFDFKRMRSVSHLSCPWGAPPVPVNAKNRQQRALLLLDQYRKKAMLYKTNVLLVPLGDDFRWVDGREWDAQTENYLKIMDVVNTQPELNAEIKFGTLSDYFAALNEEITSGSFTPSALSGDFFTYADRDDHYWSGYFTSRPFHKAMDRELMSNLRAAHIAFSLMSAELYGGVKDGDVLRLPFITKLLGHLIQSRRTLGLFQHHDAVAGTAKDHVMADYAKKLLQALASTNHVMQHSFHILTHLKDKTFDVAKLSADAVYLDPATTRETQDTLPHYNLIVLDTEMSQRLVVVFNSLGRKRSQLVRLYVSTYNVKVYDRMGVLIDSEILPVFEDKMTIRRNVFELQFVVELGPLTLGNYLLKFEKNDKRSKPQVLVINPYSAIHQDENFPIQKLEDQEVEISNELITVSFDRNGFSKSVTMNEKTQPFRISMHHYGARNKKETSGLYLFLPDGPARKLEYGKPFVRIVKGKFEEYVEVFLPQLRHRVTLYSHPGYEKHSVEIKNVVDIRNENNFELMMKMETSIASGDTFYTDLNGFQMIKRKRFEKIPIQANYYPVPTAGYIEDPNLRLTILSGQPLGGSSLGSGEFEIMLDRRLMQDDERGAGQGGTDNVETADTFRLMFEFPQCSDKHAAESPPMLSLQAQIQSEDLLHPFQSFVGQPGLPNELLTAISDYSPKSSRSLPCDVQLVDTIPLPSYEDPKSDDSFFANPSAALLLRRVGYDGQFLGGAPLPECAVEGGSLGEFKPRDLFGDLITDSVEQRTLTFVHEGTKLPSNDPVLMKPMEIYGFLAHFVKAT